MSDFAGRTPSPDEPGLASLLGAAQKIDECVDDAISRMDRVRFLLEEPTKDEGTTDD